MIEGIWKTKIAVARGEVAEQSLRLEEMGIDSSIDDKDVDYVDYWVRYDQIRSVEDTGYNDFNITLINGDVINSKENPFEEK